MEYILAFFFVFVVVGGGVVVFFWFQFLGIARDPVVNYLKEKRKAHFITPCFKIFQTYFTA